MKFDVIQPCVNGLRRPLGMDFSLNTAEVGECRCISCTMKGLCAINIFRSVFFRLLV